MFVNVGLILIFKTSFVNIGHDPNDQKEKRYHDISVITVDAKGEENCVPLVFRFLLSLTKTERKLRVLFLWQR